MVTTGPPSSEHFRMSQRPAKMPGQPPLGSGRWHSHLLGRRGPRGGGLHQLFPSKAGSLQQAGALGHAETFCGYSQGVQWLYTWRVLGLASSCSNLASPSLAG